MGRGSEIARGFAASASAYSNAFEAIKLERVAKEREERMRGIRSMKMKGSRIDADETSLLAITSGKGDGRRNSEVLVCAKGGVDIEILLIRRSITKHRRLRRIPATNFLSLDSSQVVRC